MGFCRTGVQANIGCIELQVLGKVFRVKSSWGFASD